MIERSLLGLIRLSIVRAPGQKFNKECTWQLINALPLDQLRPMNIQHQVLAKGPHLITIKCKDILSRCNKYLIMTLLLKIITYHNIS